MSTEIDRFRQLLLDFASQLEQPQPKQAPPAPAPAPASKSAPKLAERLEIGLSAEEQLIKALRSAARDRLADVNILPIGLTRGEHTRYDIVCDGEITEAPIPDILLVSSDHCYLWVEVTTCIRFFSTTEGKHGGGLHEGKYFTVAQSEECLGPVACVLKSREQDLWSTFSTADISAQPNERGFHNSQGLPIASLDECANALLDRLLSGDAEVVDLQV